MAAAKTDSGNAVRYRISRAGDTNTLHIWPQNGWMCRESHLQRYIQLASHRRKRWCDRSLRRKCVTCRSLREWDSRMQVSSLHSRFECRVASTTIRTSRMQGMVARARGSQASHRANSAQSIARPDRVDIRIGAALLLDLEADLSASITESSRVSKQT